MRVLLINSVCGVGSTGRIVERLAKEFREQGDEVRIAYGRSGQIPSECRDIGIRIGSDLDVRLHGIYTRITDRHGLGSAAATRRFLSLAEKFDPELLWLHNLHGYYLNYELLFSWIKGRPNMQVKWTLHDCWAFTGHCAYFTAAGCEKWKTRCGNCPLKRSYPESLFSDHSGDNFDRKKKAFQGLRHMELIVPSEWLKNLVKESFLKEYPVTVVPNEIDRSVFRPTPSDFRERHGLTGCKMLLGVANVWEKRKGLEDFIRLSGFLDNEYRIVLVGLSKKQIDDLPENILGLPRTGSPKELAEIYTAADLFLNLSLEETFGMTSLEAASCGTPTICYRGTACEEAAKEFGGIAVERKTEALLSAIRTVLGS